MAGYDISNLKILVVDDSEHMRKIVCAILHAFHVQRIREATDGADALKIANVFQPDLIIADWQMDPLDGIEMTRMLRRDQSFFNPFVPVIMLSGHTELKRVAEARDAGVTEFCAKPISARTLYARIVTCIENPRDFIRAAGYVGPDRKRHDSSAYRGQERRMASKGDEGALDDLINDPADKTSGA
ncbi:MAG: response regulator [Rhodospirillales bacterium]